MASEESTSGRSWSPYRRDEERLVVQLAGEGTYPEERSKDDWDPVEKTEYLSKVDEVGPAETLILEVRRHTIDDRREPDRA